MRRLVIRWGKPRAAVFFAVLVVLALTTCAHAQSHYTVTDLGTFGGTMSDALGINDSGQVVGVATDTADTNSHAFLYSGGVMQDLGTFPGGVYGFAFGINNSGEVVGSAGSGSYFGSHASLWQNGTMTDLDTAGGSYAYDINNAGHIVGASASPTIAHAVLWQNGVMTDLDTLPGRNLSLATAINQAGEIVGLSEVFGGTDSHAFRYLDGKLTDLNALIGPALGWTLEYGGDVNDHGQIVGYGTINGEQHGFLLTPSTAAPEPAALALLLTGMVGMFALRRR